MKWIWTAATAANPVSLLPSPILSLVERGENVYRLDAGSFPRLFNEIAIGFSLTRLAGTSPSSASRFLIALHGDFSWTFP